MNKEIIIVEHLSKAYKLYDKKSDRVKEALSVSHKQYYKSFYALNDISFSVERGETLGIIGTNGSGKSTLLKILAGVTSPTSGTTVVGGKIAALLELGAGFNPEYTGIENIALNGTMMGYSKEEMEQRREGIIRFADIGEYINQPVKNYSTGMFARLAFAVAISVEPDILIVDETLSVGDMRFQIKCMNKMKSMMENGTTILFVSHDTTAVRRFCHRTVWLNKGTIIAMGDTNEIADQYEDYLRCVDIPDVESEIEAVEVENEPTFIPVQDGSIAKVVQVTVCDDRGRPVETVSYSEPIKVIVSYDVYDTAVTDTVLGVALYRLDGDYICGLNTLLDHRPIPWKYGRNRFSVRYPQGLRVLGGQYYFDVALIDQTATVGIDYKTRIRDIRVDSGYLGEGRLILPHDWEDSKVGLVLE